jgi:hypothetical protein
MKDVSEQKKKSAPEAKGATAVRKFHTHSIPLDMEDIARDWENRWWTPVSPPKPA